MSLAVLAQDMASKGRGPDTMLIHMAPDEVRGLQALAMAHGGSLTINPETGLPEAGFLKKLLPAIIGFAINTFAPGVGTAIGSALGTSAAVGTGLAVGGFEALRTGDIGRGLSAGLGAYGGASLAGGMASAGVPGALNEAAGLAGTQVEQQALAQGLSAETAAAMKAQAIEEAGNAAASSVSREAAIGAAAKDVAANPMQAIKDYGKPLLAAAGPAIMAGANVQSKMPQTLTSPNAAYRPYSYDPYGGTYDSLGVYPINPPPEKAANGGLMGMADGGYNPGQLDFTQRSEPVVRMADGGLSADQLRALATPTTTAAEFATATGGYNPQDVKTALASSGLSGAAQFALTNQNIGSEANTAETYGGLKGLSDNINYWLGQHKGASANDINTEMQKWDLTGEDFKRATGKSINDYTTGPIINVADVVSGAGGNTSTVVNPNSTITQTALPSNVTRGMPTNTVQDIKDIYTSGGGSTGYVNKAPKTMDEFNQRFNTLTGGSKQAYDYLTGKTPYSATPYTPTGEVMRPYAESVLGVPLNKSTKKYLFDPETKQYKLNPDYQAPVYDPVTRLRSQGMSSNQVLKGLQALPDPTDDLATYNWMVSNKLTPAQAAAALGKPLAEIQAKYDLYANKNKKTATVDSDYGWTGAGGGVTGYALGGLGSLGSLGSYSDGGRLLKGPGDGVSDSIPATIGNKRPARLADGEFVVPARIVSELGNGSTEAGARKLYAMMDRVQKARRSTVGKGRVAKNSRSEKYLPA